MHKNILFFFKYKFSKNNNLTNFLNITKHSLKYILRSKASKFLYKTSKLIKNVNNSFQKASVLPTVN